ncbi:acetyltransferase [Rossellomorea sp. BNER]|uniref:acetyltransferase n=1 Tax=Rossellomorea sp. BNER TaxID=2962031 RepID=UPI003AF2873B|nr:acetyltransferase [Rossellomorea sp. BNER]
MKPIAIIGAGGHSRVIQDCIKAQGKYSVRAILDDRFPKLKEVHGCIYADIDHARVLIEQEENLNFILAIGNNKVRNKFVLQLFKNSNISFATVIHPSAVISPSAKIGTGTVIMPNVVINADSKIGEHVILNTNCVIEHDNIIESYAHISPSATLTGTVHIGEGSHVGAGVTIIPNKKVGAWSTVGAGAVVIQNIPSNKLVVGVPAKLID